MADYAITFARSARKELEEENARYAWLEPRRLHPRRAAACRRQFLLKGRFSRGVLECRLSEGKPEIVLVILRHFTDNEGQVDGSGKAGKLGSAERSTLE